MPWIRYGPDGFASTFRVTVCFHSLQINLWLFHNPTRWVLSTGEKMPRREANHMLPPSDEVNSVDMFTRHGD